MNKSKKENANVFQWIIPSIILVAFLMVTLFNYSTEIKNSNTDNVINDIEEKTIALSESYIREIDIIREVADVMAEYIGTAEELSSEEYQELLKTIVVKVGAQNAFVITADGTAIDSVGDEPAVLEILDKDELLCGKNYISEIVKHPDIFRYQVVIASPIYNGTKSIGAIVVIKTFDRLNNMIISSSYSGKNTYATITRDGTIIEKAGNVSSLFGVGDNLFEYLEKVTFVKSSYKKIKQNVKANRGGHVTFSVKPDVKESSTYHLIYEPMGEYGGATVTLSMDMQVQKMVNERQKITKNLITKIIVALIIYTIVLATINIINKAKYVKVSRELQNKAETDLLTDLLNKIATERKIKEYLENEGKDKCAIMFVLDIDNFKKINDTMGHAFGDEVLSTLGRRIKSEFRINDIVGRTGGDEFVVFLKDMKDENIIRREAERVATFFRDFNVGEYVKYSATASIGAAVYPIDATDYAALYKAADQALYKAKRRGKNQLAFYRDEDTVSE